MLARAMKLSPSDAEKQNLKGRESLLVKKEHAKNSTSRHTERAKSSSYSASMSPLPMSRNSMSPVGDDSTRSTRPPKASNIAASRPMKKGLGIGSLGGAGNPSLSNLGSLSPRLDSPRQDSKEKKPSSPRPGESGSTLRSPTRSPRSPMELLRRESGALSDPSNVNENEGEDRERKKKRKQGIREVPVGQG